MVLERVVAKKKSVDKSLKKRRKKRTRKKRNAAGLRQRFPLEGDLLLLLLLLHTGCVARSRRFSEGFQGCRASLALARPAPGQTNSGRSLSLSLSVNRITSSLTGNHQRPTKVEKRPLGAKKKTTESTNLL